MASIAKDSNCYYYDKITNFSTYASYYYGDSITTTATKPTQFTPTTIQLHYHLPKGSYRRSNPSTLRHKLISKLQNFMPTALRIVALTFLINFLSSCLFIATTTATAAVTAAATIDTTTTNSQVLDSKLQFAALLLEANAERLAGVSANANQNLNSNNNNLPEISNSSAFLAAITAASNGATSSISNYSSISIAPSSYNGLAAAFSTTAAFITTSLYDSLDGSDGMSSANFSIIPPEATTENEFQMPPVHAILVSIILLFVIVGTVVGNVLVCIAVCMVRKLRRPCNYLLVSLALSDLCVAVLVMPIALLYEVLERWNFGPLLCDIWVSFDVLCCTASILNLCAISVDRYLAITKPLEYGVKRTPRRMMLCVALVWLAAASISLPPLLILGNEHEDEHGEPICVVCQNFAYQIYATLGSFYIPLAVMLFVYYQIFRAARRIVLEEKRAQTHLQHALNGTGSPPALGNTDLGSGNGQRNSSYGNTSLTYSTCGALSAHGTVGGGGAGGGGCGIGGGVSGSSGLLGSPHQKKLRFQLAKEKKASTTLGIIMSAFTICWLPFFILALIRPFVESETVHVPQSLSSLFLWLGYANSLLNPIIYATLNRDFRKPFQEILYFRCSSLNTMMRENYYQDQYGEPPSQRVMLGDERHGARESFL